MSRAATIKLYWVPGISGVVEELKSYEVGVSGRTGVELGGVV